MHAERVWFSRLRKEDAWKPLRRTDCIKLNDQGGNGSVLIEYDDSEAEVKLKDNGDGTPTGEVIIECGRSTADSVNNVIRSNFLNIPKREMCSAMWFIAETRSEKDVRLTPIISGRDEILIEIFYQEQLSKTQSSSWLTFSSKNLDSFLRSEVDLEDDSNYKIVVVRVGDTFRLRKRPKTMLSLEGAVDLQRGYGEYIVQGEEEEEALGPVSHLSFVVHGIGEAMWQNDSIQIPAIVESIDQMRCTMNKKMYDDWKQDCLRCKRQDRTLPPAPNRIELIPVEWYNKIHSKSSTLKNHLLSTTLPTIPKLRKIANDVVFDILMYMTPEFCEKVLNCVTNQIVDLYNGFQLIHPHFAEDGSVSLLGHSLGSVITWDMLSLLGDKLNTKAEASGTGTGKGTKEDPIIVDDAINCYSLPDTCDAQSSPAYSAYAGESVGAKSGTWGPSLVTGCKQTLPFVPKFTFFLGSPLGQFLTLRGARPLFSDLKQTGKGNEDDSHRLSPFCLPSGSVYNIFHPSDPVAYRIEPLLMPLDFDDTHMPNPAFVVLDGHGVRLHVKARELGDNFAKSLSGFFKAALDKMPDSSMDEDDASTKPGKKKMRSAFKFKLGGGSDRVDFQLQPGVVDNEYLSAISAHSIYWQNPDLIAFLIQAANSD